jgi:hypothetical protein
MRAVILRLIHVSMKISHVPVFVVRREKARFLSGLSLNPPGNFRSSR